MKVGSQMCPTAVLLVPQIIIDAHLWLIGSSEGGEVETGAVNGVQETPPSKGITGKPQTVPLSIQLPLKFEPGAIQLISSSHHLISTPLDSMIQVRLLLVGNERSSNMHRMKHAGKRKKPTLR